MRQTQACPVTLSNTDAHHLIFDGQRGEKLRVWVLDHDLVRVQYLPDGTPRLDRTWTVVDASGDVPREGRQRDDISHFPRPSFEHDLNDDPKAVTLQTEALKLNISLSDFRIDWSNAKGDTFAADTRTRAYAHDQSGNSVFHYMVRREDEHYYGFGERAGTLDKRGYRMRMMNLDSLGYSAKTGDPLYKNFPFYITFLPELNIAYGLFYDNLATSTFDMGKEIDAYHGYYRYYHAEDGDLDYYLMYGESISDVVRKFADLTGHMVLPPRWSLGYLGSTMTYTDAPDAGEQLKKFVDLCDQHEIPCDAFHLSSGYTTGEDDGLRYVFNWNTQKIPDPNVMIKAFHDGGIHLSANIKPYFLTTHPRYEELKALHGFIQAAEDDTPETATLWSGGAFESAQGAYLDFTNPKAYEWWQAQVKSALLDYGIDSTWNDNNEYELWDDEARCNGFGDEIRLGMMRPIQTLLMTRASYEAQRAHAPDKRPFVLCRSGLPGIQRYAQTWSGDNATSWETLRYNIPMGLGMGLSGAANMGHDVGGFYGEKPSAELFLRWVQNGIFHPRFTIHSYNTDGTVNEPWMYPEILDAVRDAIRFRYRLIPYLYTLFFESHETGAPIIRPMVYDFPHDKRCHTESFDFMLGANLLVPSVLDEGARTRDVYLPSGANWYDFHTGDFYEGGQVITLDAPLEGFPLLAREGAMIPMGKAMRHIGAEADDLREVHVFPSQDKGESAFTWVEDDGISMDYESGGYTLVTLQLKADEQVLRFNLQRASNYALPYDEVKVVLPRGENREIEGNLRLS